MRKKPIRARVLGVFKQTKQHFDQGVSLAFLRLGALYVSLGETPGS